MNLNVKLIIIVILGGVFLLLPNLLRTYDSRLGDQSYFYERIVNLAHDNIPKYDDLSYGGRPFTYDLGPIYVLLLLNKFFDVKILLSILPIIFGLITLILFYLLLKKLEIEDREINLTLVFILLSSTFVYNFGSYTKFTITIPLVLLTLYFFIKHNIYKYISFIPLFLLGFFDYKAVIFILLLMLIYLLKYKKFREFYLPLFISFISLALSYLPKIIKYGISKSILTENYFTFILSDLGGYLGISIFLVFFLFFGLSYLWKSKYKYLHIYSLFLISILLIILNKEFIVYASFLFFYLASVGLNHLLKSNWESETIRKLSTVLLLIGILFSFYTSFNSVKNSLPNNELFQALSGLEHYGDNTEVVLSHHKYGVLINSISNKRNYIDSNYYYIKDLPERYKDMQTLFYSRNANLVKSTMEKYNIKYILITKDMKEGLVWNENDEGLLFVLQNSKEFRKIIDNDYAQVWKVR